MKKWTQMEYDQTKGSLGGFTELGTGKAQQGVEMLEAAAYLRVRFSGVSSI